MADSAGQVCLLCRTSYETTSICTSIDSCRGPAVASCTTLTASFQSSFSTLYRQRHSEQLLCSDLAEPKLYTFWLGTFAGAGPTQCSEEEFGRSLLGTRTEEDGHEHSWIPEHICLRPREQQRFF